MYSQLIKKHITPLYAEPLKVTCDFQSIPAVKAILFDVYGTLLISRRLNSNPWLSEHEVVGLSSLEQNNIFLSQTELSHLVELIALEIENEHQKSQVADIVYPEVNILEIWKNALRQVLKNRFDALDETLIQLIALEYELRTHANWPMPELRSTLLSLKNKGILMGIVSNSQFYTPYLLETFLEDSLENIGILPELQIWSYQLGIAKPSVEIFQKPLSVLSNQFNINPENVVYLGNDVRNDIWPAKQLGIKAILFAGDQKNILLHDSDEQLKTVRPDAVISSLDQLLLLKKAEK